MVCRVVGGAVVAAPVTAPACAATRSPRWIHEVLYAVLVVAASFAVLSPVLRRSGWPLNQGSTAPLLLVQMYAAHFRHLDLVPVWSSSDGFGLGTPVLLYYHRLFFSIAGLIDVVAGGHLKFAVVTTLLIFLAIGAYGMRLALSTVTDSRLLTTVGSIGYLFTNYVFADWLDPRGDLAEFSALMLVPWLLYWCLTLVRHRRVSWLLVPVMVLLETAHSAVALYSLFVLTIALIAFVAVAGFSGLRRVAVKLVVAVGVTAILLAPLLVAELKMSQWYDPQSKNSQLYPVAGHFESFGSYLYEAGHHWFVSAQNYYFVQIDFAIWVPVAVALGAGSVYLVFSRRHRDHHRRERVEGQDPVADGRRPATVFVLACLVVFLFLQLRIASFVYRVIAPLEVTNFPWRMLSFITPLGIILVAVIADRAMHRLPNRCLWGSLCSLWLASLVVLSPIASTVGYDYGYLAPRGSFPPVRLFTAPASIDYRTYQGFFLGGSNGELYPIFLPKVQTPHHNVSDTELLYRRIHSRQAGAEALGDARCTVGVPQRSPFESLSLTFSVACTRAGRVAIPVSYNGYSSVFVRHGRMLDPIPYIRLPTDPRVVIDVPTTHPETVVVHLPTLWGILS